MKKPPSLYAAVILLAITIPAAAQQDTPQPKAPEDSVQQNRFWQASLPGGHYMVALDRISAVSRHRYVLDGAVIVDEVTVDALGQALARFYYIEPVTDSVGGAAGDAARRLAKRGEQLIEGAARSAGTDIHEMVVKKFPETTHARTIEYRVLSEAELAALHQSVLNAWEKGRGRKIVIK